MIRGAWAASSSRDSEIASAILSRMNSRASLAWASAFRMISCVTPVILMSIWRAVMPCGAATLSPVASDPRALDVGEMTCSSPSCETQGCADGPLVGTPASIARASNRDGALATSPFTRGFPYEADRVWNSQVPYHRSSARWARDPWPLSRRFGLA